MQAKDAAILSIKILALFILTRIIDAGRFVTENWYIYERELPGGQTTSLPFTIIFTVLQIILIVVFACALWHYADRIARRIFPSDGVAEHSESPRITNKELVRIFLGVAGVWLIINSFPQLLAQIISLFMFRASEITGNNLDYRTAQFQNILFTLLRFVAGCLLLVWQPLTTFFQSLIFFQHDDTGSLVRISTSPAQCPFCKEEISAAERWACRKCGAQHHLSCWEENQGCAVFGCSASM